MQRSIFRIWDSTEKDFIDAEDNGGIVALPVLLSSFDKTETTPLAQPQPVKNYDLVIPVLLPKTKQMRCIFIQAKNRKHDQMGKGLRIEAMALMKRASKSLSKVGIEANFFIHMALRTSRTPDVFFDVAGYQKGTRKDETKDDQNKDEPESMEVDSSDEDDEQEGDEPRTKKGEKIEKYVIASCGLSDDIFPSLSIREAEFKRIVPLLQNLLRLKTAENFEKLTPYPQKLAPISLNSQS